MFAELRQRYICCVSSVLVIIIWRDVVIFQLNSIKSLQLYYSSRCPSFSNIGDDNTHQSGQLILNVENHCYRNLLKVKDSVGGNCIFQYMIFFRREEKRDFQSYFSKK